MPDLASENYYVQQVVANYINELKNIGVDGIRWDAAKHIQLPSEGCSFWPTVTAQGLYHYGEILVGPDDRGSGNEGLMKEYTNYMSVTDSTYGKTLRDSFAAGQAPASYGN
jgi:alpha-amylase